MQNAEIEKFFFESPARIAGNPNLRIPQVEGHATALGHFALSSAHAIEQIPVGCGKSGLIALLPFGLARGRVLVIAPNLEIRHQLASALDITDPTSFYRSTGSVPTGLAGPFRAVLDGPDANLGDCDDAHFVVTNIQQLASRADRWLPEFPDGYFDLILVDEGHHNVASSWQAVFQRFPAAKVISLTATPFRADEQPVAGEVIYRFPFREAMTRGYIKDITSVNVAPSEIYFTYRGDDRHHSLEEVMTLREEDWFSRGVALAAECNISIVDASIRYLEVLRESGMQHQLIAVACSMDHARQVRSLYSERGLEAREIHSDMPTDERDAVRRDLRNHTIDAVVQVRMLGEGFDHPPLGVAAVFNPFRSLSPYIQFVGRIMRVNVQRAPGHRDNRGYVVSHVGLNIDRHWADFRGLDAADQQMVREWLAAGNEPDRPAEEPPGARQAVDQMVVLGEVVDRFIAEPFLDPADDTVIDNALALLWEQGLDPEALGLTRDDLRRRILNARGDIATPAPERLPVQPQRRRQQQRRRLRERTQTCAAQIVSSVGLSPVGRRIASSTGSLNDLSSVIVRMNRAINANLGIGPNTRADLTLDQLETALASLETIAEGVERQLRSDLESGA
jgi:DNA repair protein RadD